MHRTPVSERSKVPIEIIPMEEYYLKQMDSVDKIRKLAKDVSFYPNMHAQILHNWLDSISLTGQYPEGAIMEQRYQYGRAQNAQSHMFQNLENITSLGRMHAR